MEESYSRKRRIKAAANHTELWVACADSGKQSGYDTLNSYHIGFVLGPCINAKAVILDYGKALSAVTARKDAAEAELLATRLKQLNDERKERHGRRRSGLSEFDRSTEAMTGYRRYLHGCHEKHGGIVASRIPGADTESRHLLLDQCRGRKMKRRDRAFIERIQC